MPTATRLQMAAAGTAEPAAPAFSPDDVAGMIAWYEADALALANNDPVASWTDSSGNGYHAVQGTGANRPAYKTNILNSLPAVRFDGSNDGLASGAFSGALTQPTTIFIVASVTSADVVYMYDGIASGNRHALVQCSSVGSPFVFAGSVLSITRTDTAAHVHATHYNGGSSTYWRDGTSDATGAVGAHTMTGITLGIRNDQNSNSPLPGDIFECIVYNATLSAGDRNSVTGYLGTKYGITVA